MVKFLIMVLLLGSFLWAQEDLKSDPLTHKIESFLGEKSYSENRDFIHAVFEPKAAFYKNDRVDVVKVVQTLKENGLLKLFFKTPREFTLHFKTSGSPLFFVKLMSDTLRSIGYYRYVTTDSTLDAAAFVWSINLRSEYATDPLVLQNELQKSGCEIIDIEKNSPTEWSYVIDISNAKLNVKVVQSGEKLKLKRSLYAHWLNISQIRKLKITSSKRNSWYPYIAFYDASLHLIKIIKKDKIYNFLSLNMPKNAVYMKISDLYTLKNVRDQLLLSASGRR